MLCFAVTFAFQSFMLHIATHVYVYYMEHGPESRREGDGMLYDVIGELVAMRVNNMTGGKLGASAGAVTEGRFEIPLMILDASGVTPAMICMLSFVLGWTQNSFSIKVWTQTFIVASAMALFKGVADVVTIMPDSIGWEACKERLQDGGLQQMEDMDFSKNIALGLLQALWNEVVGIRGKRVRYCSDMMVSGHTYFAVVFSIAAYKQLVHSAKNLPDFTGKCLQRTVAIVCCMCLVVEVLLVAAARFHYTVDVLMAIILVVLLFDSTFIEGCVGRWCAGFQQNSSAHNGQQDVSSNFGNTEDDGDSSCRPAFDLGLIQYKQVSADMV
jgi:hypothetical protein